MNRALSRTTAALMLGCYVLSVTVSGLLHHHGADAPHDAAGCHPGSAAPCCGHDHHLPAGGPSEATGAASPHDECPICEYLAQKPLPAVAAGELARSKLFQHAVCAKAIGRIEEPLSSIGSRGPPPA